MNSSEELKYTMRLERLYRILSQIVKSSYNTSIDIGGGYIATPEEVFNCLQKYLHSQSVFFCLN